LIGARLFALNGAQPYLALDRGRIGPRPVERIKHAVSTLVGSLGSGASYFCNGRKNLRKIIP
jgi:hypothetical protein